MQFKNGYLGAFLVVIAVVMTIAGSYVMSLDMEETTAIKYRDSADLTGLFDAEEAPSYMPFNPSANQTGYYTDRNTKYFDGVDATTTLQPNIYELNRPPMSTISVDDYSLQNVTATNPYHIDVMYWTANNTRHIIHQVQQISLSDLVTAMGLSDYNKFQITNPTTPSFIDSQGFITFSTSDRLTGGNTIIAKQVDLKNPRLTGELDISFGATRPAAETDNPILAVSWDTRSTYANLYYDVQMQIPAGVCSPSDVFLLWGGYNITTGWIFGNQIDYTAEKMPAYDYMVISDGVKLEDYS